MRFKLPFSKRTRRILLGLFLLSGAIATTAIALYMVQLVHRVDKRFAGRLWDIPSKVYSDTTLLYAGERINRALLRGKLHRLNYRPVPHPPKQPGEMRFSKTALEIYLHSFHSPYYNQKSVPVWIGLKGNTISGIISGDPAAKAPVLELEPEELMLYFGPDRQRRQLVSIKHLPACVIHAVLAAEDHRFYHNYGFEIRAILRAFIANLRKGAVRQGGSTITQQLAKNFFLSPQRTLRRKLKELLISLILEYKFDKNTILEMYLNEIYFGQEGSVSINGIGQAAWFFFGKPATDLTPAQAATIAGLIRAPNLCSPYHNPKRCLHRRNEVLNAMHRLGWLDDAAFQKAIKTALTPSGYRTYHQEAPYFADYLTDQLKTLYTRKVLSTEGLSIYTTIDTEVQSAAEQALHRGLARLEAQNPSLQRKDPAKKLEGAIIVMQPKTGYILAMVGGRDYRVSQFNRVTQAQRQTGSAFKPFVYLTGLGQFTPISELDNTPRTFMVNGVAWTPTNFEADSPAKVTLREALAHSYNVATVNLAMAIGMDRIAQTARAFHFPVPETPYPAMALGAMPLTPLSVARAYCAFAADGALPYPLSVKVVVNDAGKVLENRHAEIAQVTTPAKAYLISDLLRSVVKEGTARSLKSLGIDWPVAGKTGTTNNYRDAWFVGYTPDILALVWVGFDNGDSIGATGAQAALPIWADLMRALPQYVSGQWLTKPPGIVTRRVCLDSAKTANSGCCKHCVKEVFLAGSAPPSNCSAKPCRSSGGARWLSPP